MDDWEMWLRNDRSSDACPVETKEGAVTFVRNGNGSKECERRPRLRLGEKSGEPRPESDPINNFGKPLNYATTAIVLTPPHDTSLQMP